MDIGELNTRRVAPGVEASVPYSQGIPKPPTIQHPGLREYRPNCDEFTMTFTSMYENENADPFQLGPDNLALITRNRHDLVARSASNTWKYPFRREAQQLLDFLYLGPSSVIRDSGFLQREGITMVMVARDARLSGHSLISLDQASRTLGLTGEYVNIAGGQDLISKFPDIIRMINNHLLSFHPPQAQGHRHMYTHGETPAEELPHLKGKVLVTCDTGNNLAAMIVAAYIIAMFGQDLKNTIQYMCLFRFSVDFDDNSKHMLSTWQDIVSAHVSVARAGGQHAASPCLQAQGKRSLDVFQDDQDDDDMASSAPGADNYRLAGRPQFIPFRDDSAP